MHLNSSEWLQIRQIRLLQVEPIADALFRRRTPILLRSDDDEYQVQYADDEEDDEQTIEEEERLSSNDEQNELDDLQAVRMKSSLHGAMTFF